MNPQATDELRRRGTRYSRRVGSTKRQRSALEESGIELGLRRLQQVNSEKEAVHYPGPIQRSLEWAIAFARDARLSPWPYVTAMIDVLAEEECRARGDCSRTLFRSASRYETRHQGETDLCQVILAEEWCEETLERFLDAASKEVDDLVRMIGLARVELAGRRS